MGDGAVDASCLLGIVPISVGATRIGGQACSRITSGYKKTISEVVP